MPFDATRFTDVINGVRDHVLALGRFDRETGHEPVNVPGRGLTAATWVERIDPVPKASGLAVTSCRLLFKTRVYRPAMEGSDEVDPEVTIAVLELMDAFTRDFTLGGAVDHLDLLGIHGVPLRAQAGYIDQSGVTLRVMTTDVPAILYDIFDQEA